jgi:histidyl-tRNA synthetase
VNLTSQDVIILVNNRKLTEKVILDLSLPIDKKTDFSNLIDRRKKMSPEEWDRSAFELGITSAQLAALKSKLEDPELWRQSPELIRFFAAIEAMGVQDYVRFDANIIRGLLYYTGTVFEAYATRGDIRRSILGGGRYDNLLSDVGGDPLPATGFAMGDVIISLLLQQLDRIPKDLFKPTAQILVAVFDADYMTDSQQLAAEFRLAGINASCYPEPVKLSKQFKYADRVGITLAALIGPEERQKDSVAIKNLADGSQQIVQRSQAAQTVLALLGMPGRQS